ncbi:TPA: DUF1391 family protein, partial [Escherichia coli]
ETGARRWLEKHTVS